MKATYQQGTVTKMVIIRVHPGADITEQIIEICRNLGITSGCITSCIGSFQRASFMVAVPMPNKIGAGYSDPIVMEGPIELVTAQGFIGTDDEGEYFVHLHGMLSDGKGNAFGGHLVKGACPILVTCEIMISVVEGLRLARKYNPEVELNILSPAGL